MKALRVRGTTPREHPWEAMPDLCFRRDLEDTEKEEQAAEENATTEDFQGEGPAPAAGLTATHPKAADCSEACRCSVPTRQPPTGNGSLCPSLRAGPQHPLLRPRHGRSNTERLKLFFRRLLNRRWK
nr:40S ribosomal protein SA-like [Manis javanica]